MPKKRPPNDEPEAPEPHATELQVRQRVEELLRIRLDGAELWDIREYVREKVEAKDAVWGEQLLSDSQLYRYLQRVNDLIEESCKGKRKQLFRIHLAKRRNLYAKAVAAADYRTALAIADSEVKLCGIGQAEELMRVLKAIKEEMKHQHSSQSEAGSGPTARGTEEPKTKNEPPDALPS